MGADFIPVYLPSASGELISALHRCEFYQPYGGKFKIRQSLFQGALTGKESCLARDLKPRELVASACPGEGSGLGGFLISFGGSGK